MRKSEPQKELPLPAERIRLAKPIGRRLFLFLSFFLCLSVLIAAFAVSGIWSSFSEPVQTFFGGIFRRERITEPINEERKTAENETEGNNSENTPQNAVPVVAKTLSEPSKAAFDFTGEESFFFAESPVVFLYCSNPNEAYLPEGESIPEGEIGTSAFSAEPSGTVRAVAEKLTQSLNESGITAIYGEPKSEGGYLGSTARAGELLRETLKKYPQISLVIEIGRDSILDEAGNYIKTVANEGGEPTAQILAVVGSGESGIAVPAQEKNLKLANALQCAAESEVPGIFRGIRVKSTPQNQQYAPLSLSLLVGSGANSPTEAERAISAIAKAIVSLIIAK